MHGAAFWRPHPPQVSQNSVQLMLNMLSLTLLALCSTLSLFQHSPWPARRPFQASLLQQSHWLSGTCCRPYNKWLPPWPAARGLKLALPCEVPPGRPSLATQLGPRTCTPCRFPAALPSHLHQFPPSPAVPLIALECHIRQLLHTCTLLFGLLNSASA